MRRPAAAFLTLLLALGACARRGDDGSDGALPPTARPDLAAALRADLKSQPSAADSGGRAWLVAEESDDPATAGAPGRWTIVFEAGELGVVEGGMVFLQVSPFWGWSTPQVVDPDGYGFTEVTTEAEGMMLESETLDQQLLGVRIAGRALTPGERIRFVYGAGSRGAIADRYAESASRFWIAVDGDGDGRRRVLTDSPAVAVVAGPAARLVATLPSTARQGDAVTLRVAVLDAAGNSGVEVRGLLLFTVDGSGLEFPGSVELRGESGGVFEIPGHAVAAGVHRVRIEGPYGLVAESNPVQVGPGPRIVWGDLHGHSGLSDGTGTPEDYLRYARDVAALDVIALTDHDHWGMLPLAAHGDLWETVRAAAQRFHRPGEFVTLLGYEWTNWIYGHRHVLYFEDRGEVLSSTDPGYDDPAKLWAALRGRPALTFAHHSAGGPVATDWSFPPDPELEPVTEIVSVHGSSEAEDTPGRIYQPLPGNFVRDVLDLGYRLGFVGSGDGHDGHPGLAQLASRQGGLAAILSKEVTRDAVMEALKARRVYATNGARIVLRATLDGAPIGAAIPLRNEYLPTLAVEVIAPGALRSVEIVRSGELVESIPCGGGREISFERPVENAAAGEYLYIRVLQEDGGAAWSSPFFFE